jgi:hypothetical protein
MGGEVKGFFNKVLSEYPTGGMSEKSFARACIPT